MKSKKTNHHPAKIFRKKKRHKEITSKRREPETYSYSDLLMLAEKFHQREETVFTEDYQKRLKEANALIEKRLKEKFDSVKGEHI